MQSRAQGPTQEQACSCIGLHTPAGAPTPERQWDVLPFNLPPAMADQFLPGNRPLTTGQQPSYLRFLTDFQFPLPLSAVWEDLKSGLLRREGCSSKAKLSLLTQFTAVTESPSLGRAKLFPSSCKYGFTVWQYTQQEDRDSGFWGLKRAGTAPRERAQLLLFMERTIFSSLGHIHFLAGWWGWNGVKPMPRPTCHAH